MSGLLFWLPVVKMSWGKNSKKKHILLVNFYFLIHFDFSNTRIFSISVGSKVMNPKMPLCSTPTSCVCQDGSDPTRESPCNDGNKPTCANSVSPVCQVLNINLVKPNNSVHL